MARSRSGSWCRAGARVSGCGVGFQLPAGSDRLVARICAITTKSVSAASRSRSSPRGSGLPIPFKLAGECRLCRDHRSGSARLRGHGAAGRRRERLPRATGARHPPVYPLHAALLDGATPRLAVAASIDGAITTPWRVVIVGRDLNTLVNSDAVHNLCPPPDKALFPRAFETAVAETGRAVWRYLDGGENSVAGIKEFSRLAGEPRVRAPGRRGPVAEVVDDRVARGRRMLESARRGRLGLAASQHARGSGEAPRAVRVASAGRRQGRQGGLPRSRSQGGHRSLSGDPAGRGGTPADDQLPRRQQAGGRIARGRTR